MSRDTSEEKPPLIWLNILVFSITAAVAIIGVPLYGYLVGYDAFHWIATVVCIGYCGMSITAGYHRMWSHGAYKAHWLVRAIYAVGGAFALQNSALHWASDHRVHHRFVDQNDKDPYSAKRGFFYSHIGWMLREYQAHRYDDYENVRDLKRDKIVMWQHRNYLWFSVTLNFAIPILIGVLYGDVIGMFLTVGVLRLVISHHVTFLINSLAHAWGKQPYTDTNTARDNGVIAFLTYGEGYHNFHHHFQFDYRNGIKWWQFDPTKWLIKTLSWLKLASNLRQCDEARIEQAKAEMMLKRTCSKISGIKNQEELMNKLKSEYENYCAKVKEYYALKRAWLDAKTSDWKKSYELRELRLRYKTLKQSFLAQKKIWKQLNQHFALQHQFA